MTVTPILAAKLAHIRTDPICVYHRPPRGHISTWWFDRHRGLSCRRCATSRVEHRYDPETGRCACGALDHPDWGVPA